MSGTSFADGVLTVELTDDDAYDLAHAIDDYLSYLADEPVLPLHTDHPLIVIRTALKHVKP